MMRILAFSDWRVQPLDDVLDFVRDLEEPVDFILYGGDDIARFEEKGLNYFSTLSEYTKQEKVLAVIGNDDSPSAKRVLDCKNVYDLHENPFVFKDFAFIGLEASTSGPAIVKHTEKEVKEHLANQYAQVEGKKLIILSHTPPHGLLDLGIRFTTPDEGAHHIGSTSLRDFIQQNRVTLAVCGHCHSHGRRSAKLMGTMVVNVSSHDYPGSKGNFALIRIDSEELIGITWYDTLWKLTDSSLQRLHSVKAARAAILNTVGFKTVEDLAKPQNLDEIVKKSGFSLAFLKKLQLRAKSVVMNTMYQIAPFTLPKDQLLFFDIETDIACKKVWLIGVLKDDKFSNFYADNWDEERKNLLDFLNLIKNNPERILVSYSGTRFDRNVLHRALTRLELDSDSFGFRKHIDLCQLLRRCFIFPNQSFALKDLGRYFKYPFKHPDLEGRFVAERYHTHVNENKPIDPKVFEYNEDDVRAMPFMIEQITKGDLGIERVFLQQSPLITIERGISEEMKDLTKDELILLVRDYYEKFGKIVRRIDKRDNSLKVEIRFYAKSLDELIPLITAMVKLGFNEGSPYQYPKTGRYYIPYYGVRQVTDFIKMVKPRSQYDTNKVG